MRQNLRSWWQDGGFPYGLRDVHKEDESGHLVRVGNHKVGGTTHTTIDESSLLHNSISEAMRQLLGGTTDWPDDQLTASKMFFTKSTDSKITYESRNGISAPQLVAKTQTEIEKIAKVLILNDEKLIRYSESPGIEEMAALLESSGIATYAGFAGALYGMYSAYQQTQILRRINKLIESVSAQIAGLASLMHSLYERRTIDDAWAKSQSAIFDLEYIDDIKPEHRNDKINLAISKNSEAVAKVNRVTEYPAYVPMFVLCASNEIMLLATQTKYFPERSNELFSAINRNVNIAQSFIDELPRKVRDLFTNHMGPNAVVDKIREGQRRPGGPVYYRYIVHYYFNGGWIKAFDDILQGGGQDDAVNTARQKAIEHCDSLLKPIEGYAKELVKAKENWSSYKGFNLYRVESNTDFKTLSKEAKETNTRMYFFNSGTNETIIKMKHSFLEEMVEKRDNEDISGKFDKR